MWAVFEWFLCIFFFFSRRRRHTRFSRDWSSDVCSSDLALARVRVRPADAAHRRRRVAGVAAVGVGSPVVALRHPGRPAVRAGTGVDAREDLLRTLGWGDAEGDREQVGVVIDEIARTAVRVQLRDVMVARPQVLVHALHDLVREAPPTRGEHVLAEELLGRRDLAQY